MFLYNGIDQFNYAFITNLLKYIYYSYCMNVIKLVTTILMQWHWLQLKIGKGVGRLKNEDEGRWSQSTYSPVKR